MNARKSTKNETRQTESLPDEEIEHALRDVRGHLSRVTHGEVTVVVESGRYRRLRVLSSHLPTPDDEGEEPGKVT